MSEINMTDTYVNEDGEKEKRASMKDFQTLERRVYKNFMENEKIEDGTKETRLLNEGRGNYQFGIYDEALENFESLLENAPSLKPYLFYYIRVCKRVLDTSLSSREKQIKPVKEKLDEYEKRLEEYEEKIFFLKWFQTEPTMENFLSDLLVRCKWCGHYTQYVPPNKSTAGQFTMQNSCGECGMMYPMPDFVWDSPDGRAYSYYRMSFGEESEFFYDEFEEDYEPDPKCKFRK